jgi:hypothetical protein
MPTPEFSIQISANSVAWYGAIVASISATISIVKFLQDRVRIKIKYEPGMYIFGPGSTYAEGEKHLSITVINKGRRSVRIEKAALKEYGTSQVILFADSFSDRRPKLITEESPTTTFIAQEKKLRLDKTYCVIITDGTGKEYKKYLHKFPTIRILYYKILMKFGLRSDEREVKPT